VGLKNVQAAKLRKGKVRETEGDALYTEKM